MSDAFYNALCDHQHLEGYKEGYKDGYEAGKRDAAPRWHRVEDGLPGESKEYIVYLQMGTGVEAPDCLGKVDLSYVTSMYFKKEKGIWFDEYDESYNGDLSLVDTVNDYHVTHWMPLPEPPKEEEHGN